MVPELPEPEPVPAAPEPPIPVPLPPVVPLEPLCATDPLGEVFVPEPCWPVPLAPLGDEVPVSPPVLPDSEPVPSDGPWLPLPQPARKPSEIEVVKANESRQAEITRAFIGLASN
jgi:hypothetical protein